jgi:capsular exopolysaccharide synthesis family protein
MSSPRTPVSMLPSAGGGVSGTATGLRAHLVTLRAHRLLIAVCVGVAVMGALFLSSREAPIYRSQSDVLVSPIEVATGQSSVTAPPNMDTERGIASSLAVAVGAAHRLGSAVDPRDLLTKLSVDVPAGTEILSFTSSDASPREAQLASGAFVDSYLAFRQEQATRELVAASRPLERQSESIAAQLERINQALAGSNSAARISSLTQRANALNSRLGIIQQRISDLTPQGALDVGTVLQPASRPLTPSNRSPVVNAILALFVGLLFGVGGAYLRDRLDDGLWTQEGLEQMSGAPSLGLIPNASGSLIRKKPLLINDVGTDEAVTEAYRSLRTSVLSTLSRTNMKSLMITSAGPGEGKTTVSVNLAIALASSGKRVILVSADMRLPKAAELLSINEHPGLAEALADGPLVSSLHLSGIQNLQVLPSGRAFFDPSEWFGSDAMGVLLQDLGKRADIVLLDATPALGMADALALAPRVDGVLIVAAAGLSSAQDVQDACRKLDQLGATLVGCVLNRFVSYRAGRHDYADAYRAAWAAPDIADNRSV